MDRTGRPKGAATLTAALFLFCLFGQAVSWAQSAPTASIQRSQDVLEQDKALRTRVEKDQKFYIKKIIVTGTALSKEEIEEITAPYIRHWLRKADFEGLVALLREACVKKGHDPDFVKITYQVHRSTLNISLET
ncbi:MAG: hypothetical protein V1863_01465 [Candidatus Omnitrophota bacterium]